VKQLALGAAQNGPDKIRQFAEVVRALSAVPGAEGVRAPLDEVATVLASEAVRADVSAKAQPSQTESSRKHDQVATGASRSNAASAEEAPEEKNRTLDEARLAARARQMEAAVLLALSAPLDPSRLVAQTTSALQFGSYSSCDVRGDTAVCAELRQGPMIVRDVIGPRDCPDQVWLGAKKAGAPWRWVIEATHPGVHSAHLLVDVDETLVLVQARRGKNLSDHRHCTATWSGYRPRIVPEAAAVMRQP
jgi:hypothetical protein